MKAKGEERKRGKQRPTGAAEPKGQRPGAARRTAPPRPEAAPAPPAPPAAFCPLRRAVRPLAPDPSAGNFARCGGARAALPSAWGLPAPPGGCSSMAEIGIDQSKLPGVKEGTGAGMRGARVCRRARSGARRRAARRGWCAGLCRNPVLYFALRVPAALGNRGGT